jgi:predicted Kef-type K+ transport protein
MTAILDAAGQALYLDAAMGWEILWGLILGFTLSALVDVLVSKAELQKLMPDDSLPSVRGKIRGQTTFMS